MGFTIVPGTYGPSHVFNIPILSSEEREEFRTISDVDTFPWLNVGLWRLAILAGDLGRTSWITTLLAFIIRLLQACEKVTQSSFTEMYLSEASIPSSNHRGYGNLHETP